MRTIEDVQPGAVVTNACRQISQVRVRALAQGRRRYSFGKKRCSLVAAPFLQQKIHLTG